jgi:Ca-activated chloride channel family protein
MIQFLYPEMFWLLLLPFLVRLISPAVKGLHGDALKVPFLKDIEKINIKSGSIWRTAHSNSAFFTKGLFFIFVIWSLLVTAISRPQWLGEPIRIKNEGRDILMVMDISISMRETDFSYNNRRIDRLTAVKLAADDFVKQRTNDRIGLILFGTRAYLQAPITFDRNSVSEILWSMQAGMAGNSTAIGDALGLALKTLRESSSQNEKIIILLTDGENNDGSLAMSQAITLAKNENVKIYTLGVGSEDAVVASFFGVTISNPNSEIDEKSLKQLADETKGRYFRAADTAGLQKIYKEIDKLEPTDNEEQHIQEVKDLFYIPLFIALILGLLVLLLKRRAI